jgi:hypothetical protein
MPRPTKKPKTKQRAKSLAILTIDFQDYLKEPVRIEVRNQIGAILECPVMKVMKK